MEEWIFVTVFVGVHGLECFAIEMSSATQNWLKICLFVRLIFSGFKFNCPIISDIHPFLLFYNHYDKNVLQVFGPCQFYSAKLLCLQKTTSRLFQEIIAISCSWCKVAYHNKISCFMMQQIEEQCTLGIHAGSIIPPSWIIKLPRKVSDDGASLFSCVLSMLLHVTFGANSRQH